MVDAFIISLSAANALNFSLSKAFSGCAGSLRECGCIWGQSVGRPIDSSLDWFTKKFAVYTGRLAKACESLDHIEGGDFRTLMLGELVDIVKLIVVEAAARDLELEALFEKRLNDLEERNVFYTMRKNSL